MKVQSISANNYQPNFGKIYVPKGSYFSENQQKTVDKIIETLRTPNEAYKNQTPEQYWEKRGIDFDIQGYDQYSVTLGAFVGAKEVGTGVDKHVITPGPGSSFAIGIYNENAEFEPKDVATAVKNWRGNVNAFIIVATTAILGFILVLFGGQKGNSIQQTTKPLIENIDSVAKKAQEFLPDTMKILKSVK